MTARIAVVGAGYWGKNLLRNFHELGALCAICESDPGNPNLSPYGDVKVYTDYAALLSDAAIDAVAISAPAVLHCDMVKKALESGKDVYVEKPLSLTVAEGEMLVDLAGKTKKILMVGHILQYHPAVVKLKELVSSGALGKIDYIYSNRLNIGKLRTEENILWSFAPHDISVILMLLGQDPLRVSATGGDYLNKGVYDTTMTTLEFPNGVKGHIFVSWLHPFKEQKLVVVGSKGMAVFDDVSKEKLFLYPHTIEWKEGKVPVAHKADHQVVPFQPAEPLKEELRHFLDCIETRKSPKTDGREGLQVLKILEMAEASLGKNPVKTRDAVSSVSSDPSLLPAGVFVHESAYVDEGAQIGDGSKIWHFSHVLKGSVIGKNSIIGQNVVIGPDVAVGSSCKVQNNVSLYRGVTLEDEVFCGPSCVFTNVYNPRAFIERKKEFLPTLVRRGATIGANATIVCGVTIGRYALVGAGAVVKTDVPDHAVVAGVPAKQIGWACKCGTTLRFVRNKAKCVYCGAGYFLKGKNLTTDGHR
jgi:UDP-2-acetamido-3-amino-2,3-dideoxy-glucuronate N-acetyltransferase